MRRLNLWQNAAVLVLNVIMAALFVVTFVPVALFDVARSLRDNLVWETKR